ncbi:hypothetical protein EON83_08535 [bacterium]|nr:MAG: hypothetical protein EON83_08535 [bacterium]
MKLLLPLFVLSLSAPLYAQTIPGFSDTPHPIHIYGSAATKAVFAQGFQEPDGLLLERDGNVLLTDSKAGDVIRLDQTGKRLATLATGLKTPTMLIPNWQGGVLITERGANRVVRLQSDGNVWPLGIDITAPVGIVSNSFLSWTVISQSSSQIYQWEPGMAPGEGEISLQLRHGKWKTLRSASTTQNEDKRHNFRSIAASGSTLFLSDETGGSVWMASSGGFLSQFATALGRPSGLAFSPDGALYVCDESNGGRLWELDQQGKGTIVLHGLGKPSGIVFSDAKNAFIANRDGSVWKISF